MSGEFWEQRRFIRLEIEQETKCKFLESDGAPFNLLATINVDAEILNLSPSGVCILCEGSIGACAIKRNSLIELEIPLGKEDVVINGRVVWTEKTQAGVKAGLSFDDIDEELSEKLKYHLREELKYVRV